MFARTHSELQSTATNTNSTSGLTRPSLPHVDIILSSKRPAEKAKKKSGAEAPSPHHMVPRNELPKIPHEETGSQRLIAGQRLGRDLVIVKTMITSGTCS